MVNEAVRHKGDSVLEDITYQIHEDLTEDEQKKALWQLFETGEKIRGKKMDIVKHKLEFEAKAGPLKEQVKALDDVAEKLRSMIRDGKINEVPCKKRIDFKNLKITILRDGKKIHEKDMTYADYMALRGEDAAKEVFGKLQEQKESPEKKVDKKPAKKKTKSAQAIGEPAKAVEVGGPKA